MSRIKGKVFHTCYITTLTLSTLYGHLQTSLQNTYFLTPRYWCCLVPPYMLPTIWTSLLCEPVAIMVGDRSTIPSSLELSFFALYFYLSLGTKSRKICMRRPKSWGNRLFKTESMGSTSKLWYLANSPRCETRSESQMNTVDNIPPPPIWIPRGANGLRMRIGSTTWSRQESHEVEEERWRW